MKKILIIYRLYDPTYGPQGNPKTLSVILDQDNVLNYAYYGGWQDNGSSFSKSNMQLKKSLPMGSRSFKKVDDLDKEIQSVLATGVGACKIASKEILNNL